MIPRGDLALATRAPLQHRSRLPEGVFTLATMFLLLYSHFRSVAIVAQILLNIPLAFIGGLVLTYLLVGTVSITEREDVKNVAGLDS